MPQGAYRIQTTPSRVNIQTETLPILDYDHATGILTWKSRSSGVPRWWNKRFAEKKIGSEVGWCMAWGKSKRKYVGFGLDGHPAHAHRIIWFYVYGYWPKTIDHIDLDGANNRISNLREATMSQNGKNRGLYINNASGYKGVCWDKERNLWVAHIRVDGVKKKIGRFKTPKEAYAAYCEAARRHHGEFARFA